MCLSDYSRNFGTRGLCLFIIGLSCCASPMVMIAIDPHDNVSFGHVHYQNNNNRSIKAIALVAATTNWSRKLEIVK